MLFLLPVFREPKPIIAGNQHMMLAYGFGNVNIAALVDGVFVFNIVSKMYVT